MSAPDAIQQWTTAQTANLSDLNALYVSQATTYTRAALHLQRLISALNARMPHNINQERLLMVQGHAISAQE